MEGKQSKVAQDLKWVLAQDLKWIDGQDSDLDQDKGTSSQHGEATKDTAEEQYKGDQNPSTTANKMIGGEHGKQGSQSSYPTKEEYVHVRARGVYATNSHSLAERVRREKISERMKILKDLVPGCSKITGKALILDKITDYVQSLQRQVEFLSMHQAKLIQLLDSTNKQLLAKDMHEAWIIQAGHCDGQLDSDIDQAKEALPQHGESTKDTDEVQQKEDQNPSTTANKDIGEHGKQESEASDHTKEVHIHVGARTGHATERERRDKISTRMKILQDLVPGCSKIVGKVPMLDEIINYVQSLQRQVEFLSMQLATINQKVVPNTKQLLAKDMHKSRIIQAGHCDGQLVRNIFVLAIPIATVLMAYYNPGSLPLAGRFAAVALSVGAAVIWNNILLRKAQPNASIASELLGLSLMLIAFFGYLGSHMPEGYLWLPVLCLVVCLAPLGLALFGCKESNASEIGGGHELVPAALCLV